MSLPVRSATIAEERPLLDLLAEVGDEERFAFVQDGEGLVGWGVAARIAVGTGPDRFLRARDELARLAGTSSEPVAFASFTFDPDEDASVMVVPRVVVSRRDGVTRRLTVGDVDGTPFESTTGAPIGSGTNGPAEGGPVLRDRPRYAGSTVRDDRWLEAVARALEEIAAGEYEKVVLARDLLLWSREPFAVDRLLHDLADRFPSCATFLVDRLLGASPEQLLRRDGSQVSSRVLAGTARRDTDPAEDAALGAALLASEKDRHEHDLAVRSVIEALGPVCAELTEQEGSRLVQLDNVQHLGSDLAGRLDAGSDLATDGHVLALLAHLHPTAAVGGAPRDRAIAAIRALEGMPRGRYAGPVGWCTPDGDGEFAIALRCAEVDGTRARLFAGAGIVAGSLPEAELTETWLKLQAMTGVLDR